MERKQMPQYWRNKDYVFVLQPKADQQRSQKLITEVRYIEPDNIKKALPNKKYLVPKTDKDKTEMFHRMRLLQFLPQQPIPDVQVLPP